MKNNFDEERYKIINGDSLKVLDTFEDNYFDSCVTDPPYGLTTITKRFGKENSAPAQYGNDGSFTRLSKGFMGKEWDGSGIEYNVEFWKKVYRVLKPGSFLLAFGGSRTFYRIACAIEDAGFEIRDTIMWLYGSGFPKSMNIGLAIDKKNGIESETIGTSRCGKNRLMGGLRNEEHQTTFEIKQAQNEWAGWGTALKPAYEPIIVARKPVEKSVIDNVQKYGVGGINIDECRVPLEENYKPPVRSQESQDYVNSRKGQTQCDLGGKGENAGANELGRFPANVILTYDESNKQEVCGGMPNTEGSQGKGFKAEDYEEKDTATPFTRGDFTPYNDEGCASRYFYCAKASKKDRDSGLDYLESQLFHRTRPDKDTDNPTGLNKEGRFAPVLRKNIHPTVKPVELMQYLVRLVTPNGGKVLDPFNGSGSTGKAVAFENRERNKDYSYVGIELDKEYCEISKGRIDYALNKYEYDMIQDIKQEEEKTGQLSLFDFGDDL